MQDVNHTSSTTLTALGIAHTNAERASSAVLGAAAYQRHEP
eukprot:gene865-50_t